MPVLLRKPRRLTITVSDHVYQRLIEDSDRQGRSLSNYSAFILETALDRLRSGRADQALDGCEPLQSRPLRSHAFGFCREASDVQAIV
jgi:hypothetical protein